MTHDIKQGKKIAELVQNTINSTYLRIRTFKIDYLFSILTFDILHVGTV